MTYIFLYHPEVSKDVNALDKKIKNIISKAIHSKLSVDPYRFGKPLQFSLKGARSMRVGDYRVVYVIQQLEIWILAIFHRRKDYIGVDRRLTWQPPEQR